MQPQCGQRDFNKGIYGYFHCICGAQQAPSLRLIGSTIRAFGRWITPPVTLVPGWVDFKGGHSHCVLTSTLARSNTLAGNGLRPPGANMLDPVECERARVSRNRVYDGRFFTAVRTTGVYCRPVCPVRPARGCNVEFFPSAAAAEVAGYRPCLRCRPETAPFSPAWRGSRTTVDRAMRLIRRGAIDEGSVEEVAARLGVGARHLSRLFQKHVGASPLEVAKTVRVQRAKRLIDETDLPLSEIAFRAGFGSVRRFNAVFAEVYKRQPSEIRRGKRTSTPSRE